jgi:hypothetical protein
MAALVLVAPLSAAQTPNPKAQSPKPKTSTGEVTLIGCVEPEKDYRNRLNAAKGGPLASGAGQSNEFVLSSARPGPANGEKLTAKEAVATAGQRGDYLLTGKTETELKQAINREIEVVGIVQPFKANESAKEARDRLPRLAISSWHPVGDFCPGR